MATAIKKQKFNPLQQIMLWALAFALLLMLYQHMQPTEKEDELTYSDFKSRVAAGQVQKTLIRPDLIRGEYRENGKTVRFHTIPLNDGKLIEDLEQAHVSFQGEPDRSWITSLLLNLGWIALFFFLWWFVFMRGMQSAGHQVGILTSHKKIHISADLALLEKRGFPLPDFYFDRPNGVIDYAAYKAHVILERGIDLHFEDGLADLIERFNGKRGGVVMAHDIVHIHQDDFTGMYLMPGFT